jgi:glycosyltransferase involved in cell wall biosynthesis
MTVFTVAIRAYNSASNLPRILESLQVQQGTDNFSWEVLVVDNNSQDQTPKVVKEYQASEAISFPLRYYFEERQGAAFSRKSALEQAKGDWVGFLDDDNLPGEDWLHQAFDFIDRHPQVGAFGGKNQAVYETPPPPGFEEIAVYLAIIERGDEEFCYNHGHHGVLPPGAGIFINRQAWLASAPEELTILGPQPGSLVGKGEDLEVLSHLETGGWEIWYSPKVQISHHIPAWRFDYQYLLRLAWGIGANRHRIRMMRLQPLKRPFFFVAYLFNDLRKLLGHYLKYGVSNHVPLVPAFNLMLLKGIISGYLPFSRVSKEVSCD